MHTLKSLFLLFILQLIKNTKSEIGINSFVAAILASYRGFDTLCETCVIFLAGISVLLILGLNKKHDERKYFSHGK